MTKQNVQVQPGLYWAGVDWGRYSHAVTIVDHERQCVEQFTVESDWGGMSELIERLKAFSPIGGIAIETKHGPCVRTLVDAGFCVYPINPKLSKNWRDSTSVAGCKTDTRDGQVLAVELARRHEALRALRPCDPAVEELASLCDQLRELIDERTALVQRLQDTLHRYYPAILPFFSDWTSPAAWRLLKKFPEPGQLARASTSTLIAFLKKNRIGIKPVWLKRIEQREQANAWPKAPDQLALTKLAQATLAQLFALEPHINALDKLIEESASRLPQSQLVKTLPGAGKRLVPALTAIAASGEDYQTIRCLGGVAPVEEQSGQRRRIRMRRRCKKNWRNVLHHFAFTSKNYCPWAKDYYQQCRARGNGHGTALRKLADKWLKIILRMIEQNEPYDPRKTAKRTQITNTDTTKLACG